MFNRWGAQLPSQHGLISAYGLGKPSKSWLSRSVVWWFEGVFNGVLKANGEITAHQR